MGQAGQAGLAIILIALGGAGLMYVGRRKFNRRNFAGVEEFSGYASMLVNRLFERAIKVGSVVALAAGVFSVIHVTTSHYGPVRAVAAPAPIQRATMRTGCEQGAGARKPPLATWLHPSAGKTSSAPVAQCI